MSLPHFIKLRPVHTPLLQISLHEQSCGLYPTSPVSVLSNFWDTVQKGMSRVKKAWFCPSWISESPKAQASCNLLCFHDAYRAVITMMWKPNSGIARGELRSTLSRAGSCRSSANNINEESQIRTRGLRRSGGSNGARMQWNKYKRDRPERDGLIYVSAARRPPCYVINYFLAALAAFLFSFHTYASYIIGVPMKMEA